MGGGRGVEEVEFEDYEACVEVDVAADGDDWDAAVGGS